MADGGGSLTTTPAKRGAGVIVREPGGQVLFLQRGGDCDHPYTWCWPGGSYEPGETTDQAAMRELNEETGYTPVFTDPAPEIDDRDGFKTLLLDTDGQFDPRLNEEHTDFMWSTPDHPPEPLHPGVRATLDMGLPAMDANLGSLICKGQWLGAQDTEWKEGDHPRGQPGNAGQFGSGGGGGGQSKTTSKSGAGKTYFHGTPHDFDGVPNKSSGGIYGPGVYLSTNKVKAENYGGGAGIAKVKEFKVDGRLADDDDYQNALLDAQEEGLKRSAKAERAAEILKEAGFVGIEDGPVTVIFDPADVSPTEAASGSLKSKAANPAKAKAQAEGYYVAPDKFDAAAYAKSHDEASVTDRSILSHFPSDTAAKIEACVADVMAREETNKKYKLANGEYDHARADLHRKIMYEGLTKKVLNEKTGELEDKHFSGLLSSESVAAATPAPGELPTFTVLGGRGGSGKSAFSGKNYPEAKVYDKDKAIVLDSDHIKGLLPEYEGWNAGEVHDESSEIFDKITEIARDLGLNIVHDATMKSPEKAVKLTQDFKDKGYKIEAHYMHLPRQEAAKRAVHRFLGPTNRLVPPHIVLGNTKNEEAFNEVRNLADRWSFWDNNVPDKTPPKLISQKAD